LWFTVAELGVSDTVSVGACPLTLGVAATLLLVVKLEASEAASFLAFISHVSALSFAVTISTFLDAMHWVVLTGKFSLWVTSALLSVVVLETTPAALLAVLIRLIVALGLSVTVLGLSNATSIGAGPLGGWVAAADLRVIELEAFEAAVTVIGTLI
jgi:hypothetical protein